jgi:hypothetical protein
MNNKVKKTAQIEIEYGSNNDIQISQSLDTNKKRKYRHNSQSDGQILFIWEVK